MNQSNNAKSSQSQAQTFGSQSQSQTQGQSQGTQAQGGGARSGVGPSGHEIPDAQASYGNSQDEVGQNDAAQANGSDADPDAGKALKGAQAAEESALAGKAIPGEISPRPDEQARADANPQIYDG